MLLILGVKRDLNVIHTVRNLWAVSVDGIPEQDEQSNLLDAECKLGIGQDFFKRFHSTPVGKLLLGDWSTISGLV